MADYDTSAEWRGNITAKVDEYGRRLNGHDSDIREIRVNATAATLGLTRVEASVEALRGDISRALAQQAEQRSNEFAELQAAVTNSRLSPKERIMFVFAPLLVVFISSIVLLITSHTL